LAHKWIDLFGGTEFIAPDALFKITNAGAPKKNKGYPIRCPSGGLGKGRIF